MDLSRSFETYLKITDPNRPKLDNIAAEIFLKVIELLHTARDIANISKTCRRFRGLVDRDGWRIFVQTNFPSLLLGLPRDVENTSAEWRYLAQSLTTQSRAWDRRAISAIMLYPKYWETLMQIEDFRAQSWNKERDTVYKWDAATKMLSPFRFSREAPATPSHGSQRPSFSLPQSTPFHPTIDSMLEFSGKLSFKKQTVVWSTGPEVFVQVRRSGSFLNDREFNPFGHHSVFYDHFSGTNGLTVPHDELRSGIDDVTSINLLESSTEIRECSSSALAVDFIVGRASGHIHRYSVSETGPVRVVANTFHSLEKEGSLHRPTVRSADINSKTRTSLFVACSDKVISLYKTEVEGHDVWPIAEIDIELDVPKSRAWTIKFCSNEDLLLGLGQSSWPLHYYKATPTGLVLTERFSVISNKSDSLKHASNSVYAIEPVSGVSRFGGSSNGDVFLSGCYDGVCRLYDRRAANIPMRSFHDPVDSESAVYSLASFGQERFLAGSASSILKIFDFRSDSKVYSYAEGLQCSRSKPSPRPPFIRSSFTEEPNQAGDSCASCCHDFRTGSLRTCHFHKLSRMESWRPNASIFLYGAPRPHSRRGSSRENSPIFALSSPNPICPYVYAGTTGRVYELEISEPGKAGSLADPYLETISGLMLAKRVEDLVVYEMDKADSAQVSDAPPLIHNQKPGYRTVNWHLGSYGSRFDTRWQVRT